LYNEGTEEIVTSKETHKRDRARAKLDSKVNAKKYEMMDTWDIIHKRATKVGFGEVGLAYSGSIQR
jgi:hypothetical protein